MGKKLMSLILNTLSLCELLMGHPSKDVTHYSMSKIVYLIGRSAVTPGGLAGSECQQQKQTISLCGVGRWCEEVREHYPLSIHSFCLPSTLCPVFVSR